MGDCEREFTNLLLSLAENDQFCYPPVCFGWADYVTVFSDYAQFKVFF